MAKRRSGTGDKHWRDEPDEHDHPAATVYLSLIHPPAEVKRVVGALQKAPLERRKAKDLLRASGLVLLPTDNAHVAADLAKVKRGESLSPVLLVRGEICRGVPLTIADGYHRVCASHHLDENADIPCHLADFVAEWQSPGFAASSCAPRQTRYLAPHSRKSHGNGPVA